MKLIGKSLKIEHIIIVLIATMFILAVSCIICNATEIVDSGECGESLGTVTWTLDDEGTLTITGNGKMGLYSEDYDVPWYKNREKIVTIIIEPGVSSIGKNAFYNCKNATSATIPDSVISIEECAFYECSNLESITIPASLKTVGKYAFLDCKSLKAIYISDIGAWCGIGYEGELRGLPLWQAHNLYLNGELVTDIVIPDGVTEIKSDVFAGCTSLTSVKIPDSVTSIGSDVFYQCTSLRSITIPDSVTELYGCFANCSSLTSITFPDSITRIGASMCQGCSSLTSITIPHNVTFIENSAFNGCTNLRSIAIPDSVTYLSDNAFANCTSLTEIKLPDSLTYIDYSVFKGCTGLRNITIPDGVTYIKGSSFEDCTNLTKATIYSKTANIGDNAFKNCSKLTIYGYTGSTAETYANNNSIPFVAIDGDDPYDPGEQLDYLSQLKLSARIVADSDYDEDETKLIYKNGKYENEIPVTVKLYCNIPHNYVPSAEGSETPHQYTFDELEDLGVTVNVSDLKLSLDDSLADKCQIVFEDGSGGAGEAYYGETITVRPKDRLSIHATLRGKDGSAPAEITTENELSVAATYQVCAESGQATDDARSGGNVKFTTVNVDKGREAYAPSDFVKPSVRMMYTNIIASGRPANESTAVYKDGAFDHDSFTIKATLTVKNVENDFYTEQELDAAGVTYSADYLEFESSETRAVLSSGSQSGSDIKVYNSDFNNLKSGDSHEVPLTLKINESCLPNSAGDRMLVTAKILDKNSGKTISCGTAKLNITNRDYTKRKIEEQKEDDPDNAELALRNALKVDKTINVANFPNLMFLSDSEQEAIERLLKIWLADIAVGFEMKENKSAFEKLEGYCTDKVFNKCMSYLNVDVDQFVFGAKEVKGETIIVVHTEEYGNVEALFELKLDPFSASGSIFAATGTLKCTVYGNKINDEVIGTYNGIESPVTYMNTRALADHIKKMAIATAHSCYPSGLGGDIDAVVDETVEIIFKQPAYKTLRLYGVSFPGTQFHAVINLLEEGYNEHLVRCPVDVYVYNSCGDLVGAIVDDVVDPAYDTVNMFVEDGEKKIILSDDDYHLKLTGNDDGTMDYDVTAYGADGSVKRQVQYRNVPITRGESWETNSPENPDAEQLQLSLISSEYGTVLKPDEDVKAEVEPEVYGLVLDACERECPKGETINIKATLISNVAAEDLPQGQDGITWTSSDENAATVNSKGEVTGKALGESTITASYGDGKFAARCLVKVVEKQDVPDEPHQHVFGPWATTKAATEVAAGLQTRKCSECGYAERRTVAQLAPTLPAVKITKAAGGKKSATVKWKKISAKNRKKIKKVEIQYSTDRNFRTGVKTKYAGAKKTSYKIKGLKKGKKYYVRIRAYTKAGTTVHVSKWSKSKSAKVK